MSVANDGNGHLIVHLAVCIVLTGLLAVFVALSLAEHMDVVDRHDVEGLI